MFLLNQVSSRCQCMASMVVRVANERWTAPSWHHAPAPSGQCVAVEGRRCRPERCLILTPGTDKRRSPSRPGLRLDSHQPIRTVFCLTLYSATQLHFLSLINGNYISSIVSIFSPTNRPTCFFYLVVYKVRQKNCTFFA